MLLTEIRDDKIKTRGVADCSKQCRQSTYKNEDNTSPTITNENIMTTVAINANEELDVSIYDLPGAYLHDITDEENIMILKGPVVELMVATDPIIYRKYVTARRG